MSSCATPEHHEHQLGAGPGLQPPSIMNISGSWPGFETPTSEHHEHQLEAGPGYPNPRIMSIS